LLADSAGGLRLGRHGLKATIPLEKIPNSPVQIPFLTFELAKADKLNKIEIELCLFRSRSLLRLDRPPAIKPAAEPDRRHRQRGLGPEAALGCGHYDRRRRRQGRGFLLFDPDRGEYGGIIDTRSCRSASGDRPVCNEEPGRLVLLLIGAVPRSSSRLRLHAHGLGGLSACSTRSTAMREAGLSTGRSTASSAEPDRQCAADHQPVARSSRSRRRFHHDAELGGARPAW
jgi:hypothetical protein